MWTMDGGLRFDVLAAVTMAVLLSTVLRRIAVFIEELESSRNSGQLLRRLSASPVLPVQQQPPSQPPPLELPETVLPRAVTNDTAVTETVSSPLLVCLRCLPGPIHHLAEPNERRPSVSHGRHKAQKTAHLPAPAVSSPLSVMVELGSGSRTMPSSVKNVLPPTRTLACTVAFEHRPDQLAFPILSITAHDVAWQDNDDISRALTMCSRALATNRPFVVLYNFEHARLPPIILGQKLLTCCISWANEHAREWDTHAQGLAIVLPNSLVRNFLDMVCRAVRPPQPIAFCASKADAFSFLRKLDGPARTYLKAAYPKRN
jgi:hypothetical protein